MIYQQKIPSDTDDREKAFVYDLAKRRFSEMIYDFLIQHKRGVVEIESNIRKDTTAPVDSWHRPQDVIEFRLDYIEVAYKNVTLPIFEDYYYSFPVRPSSKNVFQRIISFLRHK